MRPRLLSLVVLSLITSAMMVLPPVTAGDLYKWTDEKGRVHYSSTPPPETVKKTVTIDSNKLSNVNALPNDPHKTRAEGSGPADSSGPSSWTPTETASSDNSAPASPPVLIPPSLLPPSNPPAAAKPEQSAQPDIVEVVAQGMGIDANAALLNAYSNAVQQALGLYVDAETMVQNDQIVQDKILTYSKGFIQEATTVKQSQANDLFQVSIRAKVKRQQLLEQAKANNITVKAVEGVSLHAQVVTQVRQEQDAAALLKKTLSPFTGVSLYHAELAGEPKIVSKSNTNVFLAYPVSLYVDEKAYKTAANELISILDKVATKKERRSIIYQGSTPFSRKLLTNERYSSDSQFWSIGAGSYSSSDAYMIVMTSKDKSFTQSNWYVYTIPRSLTKGISGVICKEFDKPLIIDLKLLDSKGEVVSLSIASSKNAGFEENEDWFHSFIRSLKSSKSSDEYEVAPGLYYFKDRKFPFKLGCGKQPVDLYYFHIGAYFSYQAIGTIVSDKIQFYIYIAVDLNDLPNIKAAKLEISH